MSRTRPLRVLFVRPDAASALPDLFGFAHPREPADLLPTALLSLATAVLRGSRHRAFVHDARRSGGGNRAVRSVAAVHRADVAVIWLHPALLADGLEAARAARQGGCSLVLGAGPLVWMWADAARRAPELDGLVGAANASGLLAALDVASDAGSAAAFAEALASADPLSPAARGLDRKLLDYAAYRGLPGTQPLPGVRVDKGRRAASCIALHTPTGALRPRDELVAELDDCALLGIPRRAFVAHPGTEVPGPAFFSDLLERRTDAGRYWIPVDDPLPADRLGALRRAGVEGIDLGVVPVDASTLDRLGALHAPWRAAGAQVSGRLCFGLRPLPEEEAGLTHAQDLDVRFRVRVHVSVPPTGEATRAWTEWMEAPRAAFLPPVEGGERRIELAERARVLLSSRPKASSLGTLLGRLARR